jgi:hypothetical protein
MVAIPDQLPLDPSAGATPSGASVAPTDFGLGQAAGEADRVAAMSRRTAALQIRAQAQADKQAAMPTYLKVQAANEADYQAAVASGAAGQPGFVGSQYDNAMERVDRAASSPDLTPGQQSELRAMGVQHANALATAAASAHAAALAQPIADLYKAQQTSQIADGLTSFAGGFEPAFTDLKNNYVAGAPDLVPATAALFDSHAQAAVAAAPAAVQPQLQQQFAGMRAKYLGDALDTQIAHGQTAITQGFTKQLNVAADTVASNPASYDNAMNVQLPAAVAALPAGLREAATNDWGATLATARVKALIAAGDAGAATSELNAGKYDAYLIPKEKEALLSEADAAGRDTAPRSLDQATAQLNVKQKADAEITGILTTGKGADLTPDELKTMSYTEQAAYLARRTQAQQAFAAAGSVRDMPLNSLQALAHGAGPDPTDPDYATKLPLWQLQQKLAQDEITNRTNNPGGWAWASNGKGAAVKGDASGVAVDRGAALRAMWGNVQSATGAAQQSAAMGYAGTMLMAQYGAGVPATARQIVPSDQAEAMAASINDAPPEGKLAAMQQVSGLLRAMPPVMRLPDGSLASPQTILRDQLLAAHLNPVWVSALVDYGGNPAALGRFVAATNDPTLKAPLPGTGQATLERDVRAALAPELKASAPLPGAQALNQARIDRTVLVARSLMAAGSDAGSAAQAAAKDLTGGRRYVDTWSIPASIAGGSQTAWGAGDKPMLTDGAGLVRAGAATILRELTANRGANLYIPPGNPAYSAAVAANARWVTAPDNSGLTLMTPKTDGTWQQVADKWGRPVSATWNDLSAQGRGGAPSPFTPPPAALQGPSGPLPAFSKQSAFNALARSIETQESGGRSGLISDQGAYGVMQVLPSTAASYAQRLTGAPLDSNRLLHDDAYNRQIGRQILADGVNHYGATPGGLVLSLADYFEGRGNVEGYTDNKGYHPGLLQRLGDPRQPGTSIDQWVAHLPPKGQAYVQRTLPRAVAYLATGQ